MLECCKSLVAQSTRLKTTINTAVVSVKGFIQLMSVKLLLFVI
jgi:hypothetical protein